MPTSAEIAAQVAGTAAGDGRPAATRLEGSRA
jgi:hypothetical protein